MTGIDKDPDYQRGLRHGQEGTEFFVNSPCCGAYLAYWRGYNDGRRIGMSEDPEYERVGDNLWMRCMCGTWLLVEHRNESFFRTRKEVVCHRCGAVWESKRDHNHLLIEFHQKEVNDECATGGA